MPDLRDHARHLRRNMTDAERRLWGHLRGQQLGARFRRQAPIGPYIADFACFEPRLVLEIDGGQHADQRGYDSRRDDWLRSQGFAVLRFWNTEVLSHTEGVVERVVRELQALRASPPHPNPPPRGGRELKDFASCDNCSQLPNPPPRGGRELKDFASCDNCSQLPNPPPQGARESEQRVAEGADPTPSPLMGEGWGGGEAPRTTAAIPLPSPPPQGGRGLDGAPPQGGREQERRS